MAGWAALSGLEARRIAGLGVAFVPLKKVTTTKAIQNDAGERPCPNGLTSKTRTSALLHVQWKYSGPCIATSSVARVDSHQTVPLSV